MRDTIRNSIKKMTGSAGRVLAQAVDALIQAGQPAPALVPVRTAARRGRR